MNSLSDYLLVASFEIQRSMWHLTDTRSHMRTDMRESELKAEAEKEAGTCQHVLKMAGLGIHPLRLKLVPLTLLEILD